ECRGIPRLPIDFIEKECRSYPCFNALRQLDDLRPRQHVRFGRISCHPRWPASPCTHRPSSLLANSGIWAPPYVQTSQIERVKSAGLRVPGKVVLAAFKIPVTVHDEGSAVTENQSRLDLRRRNLSK